MHSYRRLVLLTLSIALVIYLVGVSSFRATFVGKGYDDALFIRHR